MKNMKRTRLNKIGKKKQAQLKKRGVKAYSTFAKKSSKDLKRSPLKSVSDKRKRELREYYKLVKLLRDLCDNKSELSGKSPDWQSKRLVDPHHINGRNGTKLLDPFGIIILIRLEHDIEEGKVKGKKPTDKKKLLKIVKEIRLRQGFIPC
jgi:hypothetical protein